MPPNRSVGKGIGRLLNPQNKTSHWTKRMSYGQWFAMLVCMAIGFALGYIVRGSEQPSSEPLTVNEPALVQLPEPRQPEAEPPLVDEFSLAMSSVRAHLAGQRYAQAYEVLLNSLSLAVLQVHEDEFVQVLAQLVDLYTRELIELRQVEAIDDFYERLTFDYPQYAEYQFRLGKIRVQMGNYQEALPPLAQVLNHPQYGAEARTLMEQIEGSETQLAQAEIPLTGRNGQFIVEAELDQGIRVNLLVDTGAAITAIDRAVLQQAGYDLNAEPQYFATANGVVAAPVLTLGELSLGEAKVNNLSVGALSLSMSGNVVGLLGMNFLRHYDFRIDQNRQVLILDQR